MGSYSAIFLVLLIAGTTARAAAPASDAVDFRGVVYVSLPAMLAPTFLNGQSSLTSQGRAIAVHLTDRRVYFEEGGDRVARDDLDALPLRSPVLVLGERDVTHYVPAEECASAFGYTYQTKPSPALVLGHRRFDLDVKPLRPAHLTLQVDDLEPVRRGVVLTRPLAAHPHVHAPVEHLPAGTVLCVRREVRLNRVEHTIVTRCDESLRSYAVFSSDLRNRSRQQPIDDTHLGRVFRRLASLVVHDAAIDHGPRGELSQRVAMTVDMCWSLRPSETEFFDLVRRRGATGEPAPITLFMTRWLAQYPDAMERLIALSTQTGVSVTWGVHSWDHPKRRPFLNRYSLQEVRDDTLRVERALLEWGVVPSIFYRFPGLVHDRERLQAILDLDLISVDCDSWVASMSRGRPPHWLLPQGGSILLIHGNGNEPQGIARLREWIDDNPGWRWEPLNRFISDRDAEPVTTAPTSTRPN